MLRNGESENTDLTSEEAPFWLLGGGAKREGKESRGEGVHVRAVSGEGVGSWAGGLRMAVLTTRSRVFLLDMFVTANECFSF